MTENRQLTKEEMLEIVKTNIDSINDKTFNVYFFVIDTKGNPSGSLEYLYQTALTLKNLGYNVTMLHNEKEFVGVGDWLGEEFASLPHKNIEENNVALNAADFLFIPEIFANVMIQTKKVPCKRVMILQNHNFLIEAMPVGVTPLDLGITDVITTTETQQAKIREYFGEVRSHVVHPAIQPVFRRKDGTKKLIVNIVSRDQSDISSIIKPFYWKYPIYKWVSFRDLRGVAQENFAEALREAAITIWIDDKSDFGYSAIEAIKCGSLVLAKYPERPTDWNFKTNENGEKALSDAAIWFDDINAVPNMIASIVRSWTLDSIPEGIYEAGKAFDDKFTLEAQAEDIKKVYLSLFEKRLNEFKEVENDIKNGTLKTKEK